MKPLYDYSTQSRSGMTTKDCDNLFGNWNEILTIGTSLQSNLRSAISKSAADALIGEIMHSKAPNFICYAKYLANFDSALEILGKVQKKEKIGSLLREGIQKSGQRLDLSAYLIMPVQRLPRYELLLKEIIRLTPTTHPDAQPLVTALSAIQSVNREINNLQREEENKLKVSRVVSKLIDVPLSFDKNKERIYVRQGVLQVRKNIFGW
jgi:FYVE, RhoGEF and PH domain containing 5/6